MHDTLTMAPPPPRAMAGIACLAARNIVSTLTCMTRRQFSWLSSTTDPRLPMPTLLSRKSRRPKRSVAAFTTIAQSSSRVMSAASATASPPCSLIITTVCSARCIDPPSGLSQRNAHEIAAAFTRAARERDLRAERGEVAGAMIDHLGGQVLRLPAARPEALLVRHAADGLDDGLESATLAPR